jgi:Txe/YoeB family toxin of Txe-Axe toxin-antitoxin module
MKDIKTILIIIFVVSTVLFGFSWYNSHQTAKEADLINKQNVAALNSEVEILKNDNTSAYKRIASVEDLNEKLSNNYSELSSLYEKEKLTVLSLSETIIQLKKDTSSSTGEITDSTKLPESVLGKELYFTGSNAFRSYKLWVILNNPPTHKLLTTYMPFTFITTINRDADGQYSGVVSIDPPEIGSFLNIKDSKVAVDRDDFLRIENDINKFRLNLLLGGGIYTIPELYAHLGLGAEINRIHYITINKGLNTDLYLMNYFYKFNIIN